MTTKAPSVIEKIGKAIALLAIVLGTFSITWAEESHAPAEGGEHKTEEHAHHKKLDAGKVIIDHVIDAHEWHVAEWGHKHLTIPLPIILYNLTEQKLDVFFSNKFAHENEDHNGPRIYGNYRFMHGHIISLNDTEFLDLSITKNAAALILSAIIMCILFISVAMAYRANPRSAPKGLQSLIEPLVILIRDEVAKPAIGPKYMKYLPYLLTVFFFIWINNLMGLIPIPPFGANVTGNVAVTLVLALFTFVITTVSGTKDYWLHIVNTPGVPWWLKLPVPLMPVVEFMGVFIKPFVLCVRLFANITAGHIIMLGFFCLIFIFGEMSAGLGFGVSILSVAFTVFMSCLELLVAFLQAYVFTLLSAIYFGTALEEHHHEHAHGHEEHKH